MSAHDSSTKHPGLAELFKYPLMSAIVERRTRRVSRGTSVLSGELSHQSTNAPAPLSPLEEAVLIVATGLTGFMLHDGPTDLPGGGKELGTPMLRLRARTASSPDNTQATSFFLINDDGVFLIKQLSQQQTLQFLKDVPPRWADWSEADWIAAASTVKQQVYRERLEFPGVSLLPRLEQAVVESTGHDDPAADCRYNPQLHQRRPQPAVGTGQRTGVVPRRLATLRAERSARARRMAGRRPWPAARKDSVSAGRGIEWARNGFLNPKIRIPLGVGHTFRVDYEALFLVQNLLLMGQALGLGAWVHASIFPPYIYEREPDKGKFGLGFRMHKPEKEWHQWPPIPAPLPNPVGIDGVLQAMCPPYIKSMNEAVDSVLDEKYGNQGTYRDVAQFARVYRKVSDAEKYLQHAQHYSAKTVEYVKVICNYIYDTYGRFPAHVDAFHLPGVWVQFSHLELSTTTSTSIRRSMPGRQRTTPCGATIRGTHRAMRTLVQDFRYALRTLTRSPGLTPVIVASLAIGIGANTAIFSVVNALLLKPLPYPEPDRLAVLWLRSPGINIPQDWPSPGQYIDIQTENRSFEEMSISQGRTARLLGRDQPERVEVLRTSSSLFHLLGANRSMAACSCRKTTCRANRRSSS